MCGIAGAIDPDPRRARRRVDALNRLQEHRGPDHTAFSHHGPFAIGNTRLAIQDVSPAGNQPLTSPDGRYVCVFNGEIYNHRELRSEHCLDLDRSTDGAVIPALWERMGPKCLALLRGMWTIAVIDTQESTLTLARDPFGIKPLFFRRFPDGSLAFASELTALSAIGTKPTVRAASIAEFLHRGALSHTSTPFEDTSLLAPNSWIQLMGAEGATLATGSVLEAEHPFTTGADPVDLPSALDESVNLHLRADVPTALLLSAGLDSAILAWAARRRGHRLHCFTVKVEGADDESAGAASTAAEYHHEHEVVRAELEPQDVDAFFGAMQRPTTDGLNTFLVCKAVHQRGYRVALSGLGGDEGIAGYPHMRYFRLLVPLLRLADSVPTGRIGSRMQPAKVAELVQRGGPRDAGSYDELFRRLLSPDVACRLAGVADLPGETTSSDRARDLRGLIEVEVEQYLQRTLLPDADAFSMRWSVELRVPDLDLPFFRAASMASRPLRGKAPLVRALGDRHLDQLLRRKKRGFSVPMNAWLTDGPLRARADECRSTSAAVWDHVDPARWTQVAAEERPDRWATHWTVVVLNSWLEQLRQIESVCD